MLPAEVPSGPRTRPGGARMAAEDMIHELLLTFLTAMVPVLELRGAIPVGVAAGLPPAVACAVSIVGNLVPGSSGWSAGPISRGGWCANTAWRG